MPPTIAQRLQGRDNNFNLLRFIAATVVLLDHSFAVAGGVPRILQIGPAAIDIDAVAIGRTAVDAFFVISGFLVTRSIVMRGSMIDYAVGRMLRLFPALLLGAVIVAFLLGPLVTAWPLARYFGSADLWTYVPLTGSLVSDHRTLPGVFETVPVPGEVNSSLWTLHYEALFYFALAGLALIGALLDRRLVVTFAALIAAYLLVTFATGLRGEVAAVDSAARFSVSFFTGAGLYLFAGRIRLSWLGVAGLALVAYFTAPTPLFEVTFRLALGYAVIFAALVPGGAIRGFNRMGDYSYGIYIFCWPIQQSLVAAMPGLSAPALLAISFPATLGLAVLSWHLVEYPALRQKERASRFARRGIDYVRQRMTGRAAEAGDKLAPHAE